MADKYLDALYGMTSAEVWKPILAPGYEHRCAGSGESPLHSHHDDGRKLVGRAITCTYCPASPDFYTVQLDRGVEDGLQGSCEPLSSTVRRSGMWWSAIGAVRSTKARSSAAT